jgi:hypothetical protein
MKSSTNHDPATKGTAARTRAFHLFLPLLFLHGMAVAQGGPPQILSQPTNQSALFFGSAVFSVTASSDLPISYQWVFNGDPIENATNADLVLGVLNCGQSGYYNVIVSNAAGALSSAKAQLTVYQTVVSSAGGLYNPSFDAAVQDFLLQFTNVMVTAGGNSYDYVYALTSDGTLAGYVPYPTQSPDLPPGLSGFVAISSGGTDFLALTSEGSVAAWNTEGATTVPSSVSNVLAIAAGSSYNIALKSNGTVVVWDSGSATTQESPPLSNVVAIATGDEGEEFYALTANGAVYEWYQVGIPPQMLKGLSNVIAIAETGPFLALEADGTVVNSSGVNLLPNVSNVVAVAGSNSSSFLALRSDGTLATSESYPLFPFALSNVFAISPYLNGIAMISNGAPFFTVQPGNQIWTNGDTIWLHARAVGVQPMSYQWQFNGTNILDATNADLTITDAQEDDGGQYCALASNNLGSATSRLAIVTIPGLVPSTYTLAQALGATNLPWFTFGDAQWFPEFSITENGIAAAQSGHITNSMDTELQTLVTGPGTLTFWWKVSSEEFFDFLSFYIGSDTNYAARISGEVDWQQQTFVIGPGTQTVSWIYAKDPDISVGQDAGWLDQVSFVPSLPQTNNYTLGTTALLVGPAAGMNSVVLAVAPPSGAWAATTRTPWLHLTSANQYGAGSTNVFFSYDANPGATRFGTLSIGGQALTVTQAGATYVAAGSVTALVSSGLGEPWQMAVDLAGNVYFTVPSSNTVQEWTAANNTVSTVVSAGLSQPTGLAVDGHGNVYISDDGPSAALYEWNAATSDLTTLVSNGVYPGGNNLAVDAAGNVYIEAGSIRKWTAADNTFAPLSNSPSADSLAVDIAGNVYCSVYSTWQLEEWVADDQFPTPLNYAVPNPPLRQTFGLAVDGAGNVYLADTSDGAIQKWTAATQTVTTLSTPGSVVSVAVDALGNVYFSGDVSTGDQQGIIAELPYAFVDPTSKLEGPAAGADSLPVVLPSTENLLPPFAPASDQSWLIITGITNGVISFSFTANPGPARTANIALLGQIIPVTQQAIALPPTLTGVQVLGSGVLQFAFSNSSAASFTVLSTTNLSEPLTLWTVAGTATNTAAGQYQFTSQPTPNDPQRYYLIRSP